MCIHTQCPTGDSKCTYTPCPTGDSKCAHTHTHHVQQGFRDQTEVLMLARGALYRLSSLHNPDMLFWPVFPFVRLFSLMEALGDVGLHVFATVLQQPEHCQSTSRISRNTIFSKCADNFFFKESMISMHWFSWTLDSQRLTQEFLGGQT